MEEAEEDQKADGAERGPDPRLERGLQTKAVPAPHHQHERKSPGADHPEARQETAREDRPEDAALVPDGPVTEKLHPLIARVARDQGEREEGPDAEKAKSQDLELPSDREPAQGPHSPAQVPCCQEAR